MNTETIPNNGRSKCHLRLYNDKGLVIAFDINDNSKSVAKQLFDIFTDDTEDDGYEYDGDCDDMAPAPGYYTTE